MSYTAPNPYVEGVPYKGNASATYSNSIMGMIGVTPNGDTTKAVLVTSWSEYIEKFAVGVSTPFMTTSNFSDCVFGFFQNGGRLLYVARVVGTGAAKATKAIEGNITATAKNEGAWGNKISVQVTAVADDSTSFKVDVYYDTTIVETFIVSSSADKANYYGDYISDNSAYIDVTGSAIKAVAKTALAGGDDKASAITDATYTTALTKFDKVHNLAAIAIPGITTEKVMQGLIAYTDGKPILPVLELGETDVTATAIKSSAAYTAGKNKNAVIYGPYITVTNPLSATGRTKSLPPSGHILGVIARTIDEKGEWCAAAGTDAILKGALGVATEFSEADRGTLNEMGVNVLLVKPNYGTVIWGARSLSDDKKLRYVSNLTLDFTIRRNIDDAMQKFEFKNNTPSLWIDIAAEVQGILETKRQSGAFAGTTPDTCYYVLCDESLNTQAVRDAGQVICEVGYASNSPAEFIIVRVAHQISN